ncbi:copia protein [Trifolium medium]|uniref:Copia protein n=1 Tax=Trifolium medium TaxID=97028 RepID=A0A392QGY6_9FABA|nr:copia protein [Trifolium medium]
MGCHTGVGASMCDLCGLESELVDYLFDFLGITVSRHHGGVFLSQSTYVSEIIERAGMTSCKPSVTPVDTKQKLSTSSGTPYEL